ncbi:exonuclease recombination-associated [Vibrio phage D63]
MIKNAIIYTVEMPTVADMENYAAQFTVKKPGTHTRRTMGFTKHPVTSELVSPFEGGYCLSVLIWEKKIDAAALREALNEKVGQFEQVEGRPAKKTEKDTMRDEIVNELLPHVLPSPKYVYAYYHIESDTLLIDTANGETSDQVTALLRKAIGSLKATTVYIDNRIGLTECLTQALQQCTSALLEGDSMRIGERLELEGREGEKVKYTDVNLLDDTTAEEVCAQIRDGGMSVKSIELTDFHIEWQLTDGFKFKSIKFPTWEGDPDSDNKADEWYAETFYAMSKLVSVSTRIADAFTVVEK